MSLKHIEIIVCRNLDTYADSSQHTEKFLPITSANLYGKNHLLNLGLTMTEIVLIHWIHYREKGRGALIPQPHSYHFYPKKPLCHSLSFVYQYFFLNYHKQDLVSCIYNFCTHRTF